MQKTTSTLQICTIDLCWKVYMKFIVTQCNRTLEEKVAIEIIQGLEANQTIVEFVVNVYRNAKRW